MLLAVALWVTGVHGALARDDAALPGEVLVKLRTTQALAPLLDKYPLSVIDQFGGRPIYRLQVTGQASVTDTIAALLLELDVLLAEPNTVNSSPEARRNAVWAIGNPQAYATQWAPAALRLAEAHRLSTGAGVRVAVLDTGVDRSHPALAGRLLPGFDFVDYDDDPSEEGSEADVAFGHGTHVAGLVALVAPNAMIMPLRVLDPDGQGNAWVLAEALLYAVDPDGDPNTDDGAHVINLSLGTTTRTRIFDAVAELATCSAAFDNDLADPGYDVDAERCAQMRGVVIVAAAGNDGSNAVREYPAAETAHTRPGCRGRERRQYATRELQQRWLVGPFRGPGRRHHQFRAGRRLRHVERHVDGCAAVRRHRGAGARDQPAHETGRYPPAHRIAQRRAVRHEPAADRRRRGTARCESAEYHLPLILVSSRGPARAGDRASGTGLRLSARRYSAFVFPATYFTPTNRLCVTAGIERPRCLASQRGAERLSRGAGNDRRYARVHANHRRQEKQNANATTRAPPQGSESDLGFARFRGTAERVGHGPGAGYCHGGELPELRRSQQHRRRRPAASRWKSGASASRS